MNRFLLWYIKGSAIYTIFLIITLISGSEPMKISPGSSNFVNWIYSFLIALSPLGAIIGYFVWFIFKLIFGFFGSMLGFDMFKEKPEKEKRTVINQNSGSKYIKDGKVYERGGAFQTDKEVGTIKNSITGEWIETSTGGYGGRVESNLQKDEYKIIEQDGGFIADERSYNLKKNPFAKDGWDHTENEDS
jgi:hypothetical protein